MLSSFNREISVAAENKKATSTKYVRLLGDTFDPKLNLGSHVHGISIKAGQKLKEISNIISIIDLNKKRLLVNAFFLSRFNYCPLVRMCLNRTINNKINC